MKFVQSVAWYEVLVLLVGFVGSSSCRANGATRLHVPRPLSQGVLGSGATMEGDVGVGSPAIGDSLPQWGGKAPWDVGEVGLEIDGVDSAYTYFDSAAINGGEGGVGVSRTDLGLDFEFETGGAVEFSLGAEYSREDWSYDGAGTGIVPGLARPWDGFERYAVELGGGWQISPRWRLQAEVGAEWGSELGEPVSDEMLLETFTGAVWRYSERLSLLLFILTNANHEESADIIPILGFDWRITDRDRLRMGGDRGILSYTRAFSSDLSGALFADFANDSYRLGDSGVLPGGAINVEGLRFGAGLDWKLGPGVLRVDAGYAFERGIEIFDQRGGDVGTVEFDDSLLFRLSYSLGAGY